MTAEAKVREGSQLPHHHAITMDNREAGARTEKRVLLSADHKVGSGR